MRKLTSLILILCLLAGTLAVAHAGSEPADEAAPQRDSREYTFYLIKDDPGFIGSVSLSFFDGVDDLPWIEVSEMTELICTLQNKAYGEPAYRLSYNGGGDAVTLMRENHHFMILDYSEDTIAFSDYNAFLKDPSDNALLDQLSFSGFDNNGEAELFQRDALASFDRYGDLMVLDLKQYGIGLIHEDGHFYIPLQTANDFLFVPMFRR